MPFGGPFLGGFIKVCEVFGGFGEFKPQQNSSIRICCLDASVVLLAFRSGYVRCGYGYPGSLVNIPKAFEKTKAYGSSLPHS